MTLTRRSFLAASAMATAPWVRSSGPLVARATGPMLTCEVSGLTALVRHPRDRRIDALFVDPSGVHGHLEKHEPVLVARYDDVNWAQTTLRPVQQFADESGYVVMWKLDGLDLRFLDADTSGVQVAGGTPLPTPGPARMFPKTDDEWHDLQWVPHMNLMSPESGGIVSASLVQEALPVNAIVRSRIRFTEGTARAMKPRDPIFRTYAWTVLDSKTFQQVAADRTAHAVPQRGGRTLLASPLGFVCDPQRDTCRQIVFQSFETVFWMSNLPPGVRQPPTAETLENSTPTLEHVEAFYDLLDAQIPEDDRQVPFRFGTCCANGQFVPVAPMVGRIPITCGRVVLFAK